MLIIIIIAIPLTYFILTVINKIKKKKPTWFDGVKGKIIFGVDVVLLIILPIILLALLTDYSKTTKDFLFTLLTATISMMVTFIVKLVYFILYGKYCKVSEDDEKNNKKHESLYNLEDIQSE